MDMNTYVVANPHKCISCKACEIACAVAHLGISVVAANMMNAPFLPRLNLVQTPRAGAPIQCHQCENAPCAAVCPVGAITRRDDTNIVNSDKCIGCKSCLIACPFGAIDLAPDNGRKEKLVAHKCDICCGRNEGPACAESCPASAFVVVKPVELRERVKSKRAEVVAIVARTQPAHKAQALPQY
jgi:electron transport protein HydN